MPKNQRVVVPITGRDSVNFKIAKNLKVSDKVIQVSDLKADRNYTKDADPFRKFANMANNVAGAENQQNETATRLAEAQRSSSQAQGNAAANPATTWAMPRHRWIAMPTRCRPPVR
jgi:hypothetical protein